MTRKMNTNVHIVSHVKEKIVHIDTQSQAERQKLVDIDKEIAKVSNVQQLIPTNRRPICYATAIKGAITHWSALAK